MINYVIGFCKNSETWIHPLEELGYEVRLIEQSIRLMESKNDSVKPDVVAVSNKLLHSLVFDCKSGKNIETDQAARYKELTDADLLRWVGDKVYATKGFSHEICYVCIEDHRNSVTSNMTDFPVLSISKEKVSKTGSFAKQALESKFKADIPLDSRMVEPLSYYPFSSTEDRSVIIPYVMRAIITLLIDKKRRGAKIFDHSTYQNDEIMTTIHKMWNVISQEEQKALHQITQEILDHLRVQYPKFHEQILEIQSSSSDSKVAISNLVETCEQIAKEEQGKMRLDQMGI
ncbi:MAG: hypothetical protein JRN20_06905 [Nitrososphaerota archaeon]|nr:hypothetical protein [Nitrososphaerota archaeon]